MMLFNFGLKAQSLQSFGLKGKVKSIHESCNECSKDVNNEKQCLFHEMSYLFTNQGEYVKPEEKVLKGEYLREKKDTANGVVVSKFKKVYDVVLKYCDQFYDTKDLLLKIVYYDNEGKVKEEYNSFYTKDNVREKVIHISYENGLTKTIIRYYDEYGNFSGDETYQYNKLVEKREFEMKYELDKFGNWIYKYVNNGTHTLIHNREIIYY